MTRPVAENRMRRRALLQAAHVYVLIDAQAPADEFFRLAQSLVQAGADVLQLRDKTIDDRQLLERARVLRSLTRDSSTLFVINDRPDLALLADADGVHVGQEELSVTDVRQLVGPDLLVGVSTHSLRQAHQAVDDRADYIGVGPTFPSTTKAFDSFTGLDLLNQVARQIDLPAFAIGGISLDRMDDVLGAGIRRVAVAGAITGAADPADATRAFVRRLAQAGLRSGATVEE
ncbi:MAG: thiamine phosphate synthase [Pirellulales bacterium]